MSNTRTLAAGALGLAVALAFSACGGSKSTNTGNTETSGTQVKQVNPPHDPMSSKVLNVKMGALNGSNQDGTATVADKGNGVEVTVHLNNEPKGASEPEHIHHGPCKTLNPAVWKPLKNVVNGTAQTFVPGVTSAQLVKGNYAINVHKSLKDISTYVSCGNITA